MDYCELIHHDTYDTINPRKLHLSGKHVFITGASKGIGRALALSYAQAGASAIGISARSVPALESLEQEIYAAAKDASHPKPLVKLYAMDVSDLEAVQKVAQDLDAAFSHRIDILVNNAGYLEAWKPIAESDPSEWWKTYTVNVLGPYHVSRAMLPIMLQGGMRQVVNVGSVGGLRTTPGASAYQSTKFVLARFSEFIDADYGEQGVIAFTVHPGGVMTELAQNMPQHWHHLLQDTAEMAADAICYLTGERRDWLAGRYVSTNWDMDEFMGKKDEIVKKDLLKFKMRFE